MLCFVHASALSHLLCNRSGEIVAWIYPSLRFLLLCCTRNIYVLSHMFSYVCDGIVIRVINSRLPAISDSGRTFLHGSANDKIRGLTTQQGHQIRNRDMSSVSLDFLFISFSHSYYVVDAASFFLFAAQQSFLFILSSVLSFPRRTRADMYLLYIVYTNYK